MTATPNTPTSGTDATTPPTFTQCAQHIINTLNADPRAHPADFAAASGISAPTIHRILHRHNDNTPTHINRATATAIINTTLQDLHTTRGATPTTNTPCTARLNSQHPQCDCPTCATKARTRARARRQERNQGIPATIPAHTITPHIRDVLNRRPDATPRDYARAADVHVTTIRAVLNATPTTPTTIRPLTAQKILTVTPTTITPLRDHRTAPADQARTWITHMKTLGWTDHHIATASGVPITTLREATTPGRNISGTTARGIWAAHQTLNHPHPPTPPPSPPPPPHTPPPPPAPPTPPPGARTPHPSAPPPTASPPPDASKPSTPQAGPSPTSTTSPASPPTRSPPSAKPKATPATPPSPASPTPTTNSSTASAPPPTPATAPTPTGTPPTAPGTGPPSPTPPPSLTTPASPTPTGRSGCGPGTRRRRRWGWW